MLIVTHDPALFGQMSKEIRFENGAVRTYGWQKIEPAG